MRFFFPSLANFRLQHYQVMCGTKRLLGRFYSRIVSWDIAPFFALLALSLAPLSSARADAIVAMLYAHGWVRINDSWVGRSAPVFVGDKITTAENSSATIISMGTQVFLPAQSAIAYENGVIQILQNRALITTLSHMGARAGPLTITPSSTIAQFEVSEELREMRVSAQQGFLSVADGERVISLSSGMSLLYDSGSGSFSMLSRNAASSTKAQSQASNNRPNTDTECAEPAKPESDPDDDCN
jgi:hypothetical protein